VSGYAVAANTTVTLAENLGWEISTIHGADVARKVYFMNSVMAGQTLYVVEGDLNQ
jgi:hypothetical protein